MSFCQPSLHVLTGTVQTNQVYNQFNCFSFTILVSLLKNNIHQVNLQEPLIFTFIEQYRISVSGLESPCHKEILELVVTWTTKCLGRTFLCRKICLTCFVWIMWIPVITGSTPEIDFCFVLQVHKRWKIPSQ